MPMRTLATAISTVAIFALATSASAQSATPTFELSAGYQFTHAPDQTFPFGLNIDGMRHYGSLGLVGEAGWARHSDTDSGPTFTNNMWNFGAGPRWTGFGSKSSWPYAQVLAGIAVSHMTLDTAGVSSDTRSSFMVQPGIGMTFVAGDGWGVFGQVDYRRTFFDEATNPAGNVNNQFRVFAGLRMILD
jgi:outer membrane protein with beta-barrel domain